MKDIYIKLKEIGVTLSQLGNELQKQAQSNQPLNIHSQVKQTMDNLTYYLHNLNADLDAWRKEMLAKNGKIQLPTIFEGTDGVDVETAYCALHHLLHSKSCDDWDRELSFTEELQKLGWLFEELQNTPEPIRYSKASYGIFNFDKIEDRR